MASHSAANRIAVLHGVNLDMLGKRDPEIYGSMALPELELRVRDWARDLGFETICFQTNHEGAYVEELHRSRDMADGLIVNPGAWSHYSYAIRDALEIAALPTVEVHLSDVKAREKFRRTSVISDLCVATVSGKGADGYHEALQALKAELAG